MEIEKNYKLRKFFIAYSICLIVAAAASAIFLLLFKAFVEDGSNTISMVFGIASIFGVMLFVINAFISVGLLIVSFASRSTLVKLRFLKLVRVVLYIVTAFYLSVFVVGTLPDFKGLFLLGKVAAAVLLAVLVGSYFINRKDLIKIMGEIKRLRKIKRDEKRALRQEKSRILRDKRNLKLAAKREILAIKRAELAAKTELRRAQAMTEKQQKKAEAEVRKEKRLSASELKHMQKQDAVQDRKQKKQLKPKFVFPFKKFPFAVLCLSVAAIIIFCSVNSFRDTTSNTQLIINLHVLPLISLQFIYFGLYLRREFKGIYKVLGILLILMTPFVWATTLTVFSDDKRFLVNILMPLVPVNSHGTIFSIYYKVIFEKFDIAKALITVLNAGGDMQLYLWSFYGLGYSSTLYLGLISYLVLPLIKRFKISKDSNWRYFIAIFILPILTLVILAAILALLLTIIYKLFGGSASSSSYPSHSYSSNPSGESQAEYVDNRNYKTREMEGLRRVQLSGDGRFITDLNTGRSYGIYNYNQQNGYLEDVNGNIYYFNKFAQDTDNFEQTDEHRRSYESEFDAQRRLNR